LKIYELHTKDLIPYENNPRKNEEAVEVVKKSITEFGFKVPIVIDENYVIVTGHTRLKAAKELGLEKVPCIMADDLSAEQIKAFRLADNKASELSSWDLPKLELELEELTDLDFNMGEFGFDIQEPDLVEDDFDFDEAVAQVKEPVTKPGDIWQLGRHRLMCGDSTEAKQVDKLMEGYKARLIITDPPYNVDYTGGTGMKILNDSMDDNNFRAFLLKAYKCMHENMMSGAPIYVFHADSEGYNFRGAFKEAGFKLTQCLIWVKSSLVLGRQDYHWRHEPILYGWKEGAAHFWYGNRDKDTVIDEDKISFTKAKKQELIEVIKDLQQKLYDGTSIIYHDKPSINDDHPTMKPVKLIGKLMHNSSEKGDLVLDSFGGSGATLMAAEQAGRICNLMELDPVYCDVIVKRWEEYTKLKAVRKHG
jgi:DNA modification methylase